jgi:tetratricopeptide (TPR) repeat protein
MEKFIGKFKFVATVACCAFFALGCLGTPTTAYHQAPLSVQALSNQERSDSAEDIVNSSVKRGDEEYAAGNFSAAKNSYYKAMLAQPDPDPYILASYAITLSQLGHFDNALEIFKMALAKYPDSEIIHENLALSRRLLAEQMEQKRALEMENARQRAAARQQQQTTDADEFANNMLEIANSLQGLANAINAVNNKGNYQSGGYDDYGNSGGYQGGNSNNAKTSKRNNYNCGSAMQRYSNATSSAQSIFKRYQDDPEGRYNGGRVAKNDLKNAQSNMRNIRNEAARNDCKINKSNWEDKIL